MRHEEQNLQGGAMKDEKNLTFIKGRNGKPAHYLTDITLNWTRVRRFAGYTKEQARMYLGKLRIAANEGKLQEIIKPKKAGDTFGEYGRALLNSAEWKAKRSHERDENSFTKLKRNFRDVRLADITPGAVRRYITMRKEGDGRSAGTVNRELSFLKSVLYQAECDGLIPSNPIRGKRVKKLVENNHREKTILALGLTDDDLRRLVDLAADYLKPIMKMALTTGMRQGEIFKAKWKDANFQLGTLRVPEENAKSKKERVVRVDPDLCVELDSMPRNGDYIFFNPETRKERKDVRGGFQAACDAAKIPYGREKGIVFHDLRHFAAYYLVKVTDIVMASKILGHASLDMTLRYVHPTEKDKHSAVQEVAKILFASRQNPVNDQIDGAQNGVEKCAQLS
jgi:integrase/recombinase XerD